MESERQKAIDNTTNGCILISNDRGFPDWGIPVRSEASREAYKGSALAAINTARRLATRLGAIDGSDEMYLNLVAWGCINTKRITTLASLCSMDEVSGAQIDEGREPYLLRHDALGLCELTTMPIYDHGTSCVDDAGNFYVDVHAGIALLPGETLIYWK